MKISHRKVNTRSKKIMYCLLFAFTFYSIQSNAQSAIKGYEVKKLAEGVYSFVWKEPAQNPIESYSLFVINQEDVVVVDACWWPSATELMIKELKKLSNKPVKYVINTHWHNDHLSGNYVYKKYWPGVEFIAHTSSRKDYQEQIVNERASILNRYKVEPAEYVKWLKEGKDATGKTLDSARRNRVQQVVDFYNQMTAEFLKVQFVLPDHLISDSFVLYRGDRIIKVLWLGRGNTRGDVVLFLPKEKIVATGDLVVSPIPFGFGSYYKEWIQVLSRLESLDANFYIPGHGPLLENKDYIRQLKDMLNELVTEVDKAVKEGLSFEEIQKRITLAEWRKKFAGEDPTLQRSFDAFFLLPSIEGAWHQAKGDKDGG